MSYRDETLTVRDRRIRLLRLDPAQMRAVLFADPAAAVAQELVPDTPASETLEATLRARNARTHGLQSDLRSGFILRQRDDIQPLVY